jgi:5-methylcytosine-specific restriction protein A
MSESTTVQQAPRRNPPWKRDEIILALELYMQCRPSFPGSSDSRIVDLSALLNELATALGGPPGLKFRNPNGVAMKLQNLRRFDIAEQGKGLLGGGKLEEEVWATFAENPQHLAMAAAAIRNGAALLSVPQALDPDAHPIFEADEGEVVTRRHLARERSRAIVERKKAEALAENGKLACEACGFDFTARYGDRGQGFIECHHLAPLSDATGPSKTKLSDLALICANCHRMIHIRRPWLTLVELQAAISKGG